MIKEYPIVCCNQTVGVAEVKQEGLYMSICCVSKMKTAGLYRVRLMADSFEMDLGTCLRIDGSYQIRTRIQAKHWPGEHVSFHIYEKDETDHVFYPIEEGKPFPHISKLPFARLVNTDGMIGVTCSESTQQDSDQNP